MDESRAGNVRVSMGDADKSGISIDKFRKDNGDDVCHNNCYLSCTSP